MVSSPSGKISMLKLPSNPLLPLRLLLRLNTQPYQLGHPGGHINCHEQWNQEERYITGQ